MTLIHWILNAAALLLWISWRSSGGKTRAKTTLGNIALTQRNGTGWYERVRIPGIIVILLLTRALLYWQIGSAVNWTPRLDLTALILAFRSDYLIRALWFSLLSFALLLAGF